jgi:hypothetical protein
VLRPKVVIADERHGAMWFEWRLDDHIDDAMAFFRDTGQHGVQCGCTVSGHPGRLDRVLVDQLAGHLFGHD